MILHSTCEVEKNAHNNPPVAHIPPCSELGEKMEFQASFFHAQPMLRYCWCESMTSVKVPATMKATTWYANLISTATTLQRSAYCLSSCALLNRSFAPSPSAPIPRVAKPTCLADRILSLRSPTAVSRTTPKRSIAGEERGRSQVGDCARGAGVCGGWGTTAALARLPLAAAVALSCVLISRKL